MPSWSPSEPPDSRPEPQTSPTPQTGEDQVAAARRLLADLFEEEPDADDEQPDR